MSWETLSCGELQIATKTTEARAAGSDRRSGTMITTSWWDALKQITTDFSLITVTTSSSPPLNPHPLPLIHRVTFVFHQLQATTVRCSLLEERLNILLLQTDRSKLKQCYEWKGRENVYSQLPYFSFHWAQNRHALFSKAPKLTLFVIQYCRRKGIHITSYSWQILWYGVMTCKLHFIWH